MSSVYMLSSSSQPYYLINIKNAMFNFHNIRRIMFEKHLLKYSHGIYIYNLTIFIYMYVIICYATRNFELINKTEPNNNSTLQNIVYSIHSTEITMFV